MHDIDRQLQHMLKGDFKTGWTISEKLQKLGQDEMVDATGTKNPEIWLRHNFNRGWFLLQQGKYQEGSQLLESGRYLKVYGSGPLQTSAPIFNPEVHKIVGKSIIISLEGGYGDEIIHARYATKFKELGASKVYIAAAPEIASIFSRIKGVDGVIQRDQANTVQHDYWIPGFSAGWVTGTTYENMKGGAYLTPIDNSVDVWKSIINSDKKKIGIRWAGNPKFEHQQFRKFPPEFLINLAKYDDVQVYSLQRDHNIQSLPEGIIDLQHMLISWEDTLAAISNLDLVITSCTSIAHAAAALGKETWVLVPVLPYHIWAYNAPKSTSSPYYNSAKIYRQQNSTSWNDTFQKLYLDLETKFNLQRLSMPNEDIVERRLNLGCGFLKMDDFENVDYSATCRPDKIVDLNAKTWDLDSDSYSHIVAKDILEHLDDTVNTIKEMYRISRHGAIWEIQVPHHRCDNFYDDPTHKSAITPGTIKLFDMQNSLRLIKEGWAQSYLSIENNIDIELCEVKYDYTSVWAQRFEENNASQDEIDFSLNHMSNVAESTKMLIQVFKPARFNKSEIEQVIDERYSTKS